MAEPVKLTRCYPGAHKAARRYRIGDSAINVQPWGTRGWTLTSDEIAGQFWLNDQKLNRQYFETRASALRAYQALAALCPPPDVEHRPQLHCLGAGRYQLDEATITRHPSRKSWVVSIPDYEPKTAISLADATQVIADMQWQAMIDDAS